MMSSIIARINRRWNGIVTTLVEFIRPSSVLLIDGFQNVSDQERRC